jgi:hypothetical protein
LMMTPGADSRLPRRRRSSDDKLGIARAHRLDTFRAEQLDREKMWDANVGFRVLVKPDLLS